MFEKRKCFCNIKVQGKAASADIEAAASYLENLTKFMRVAMLKTRFSM